MGGGKRVRSAAIGVAALALALPSPAAAKDSLGVFGRWGAFRDPSVPRCYAIAQPTDGARGTYAPFASIGTWPKRKEPVRGQLHIRLSRKLSPAGTIIVMPGRS